MGISLRNDIVLDGHALTLYRSGKGRAVRETSIPALAQETFSLADERVEIDTFHLGAFYSQRLLAGTYAYGDNFDGRHPRVGMPGPRMNSVTLTGGTTPRCAADFNGSIWVGGGRYVYSINPSTFVVTQSRDLGAGNRAWAMKVFRNELIVGLDNGSGTPQDAHRVNTSGTWDTLTGNAARCLETVWWDTDYRLLMQDTTTTFKHTAGDPSGALDGPVTVGDSASAYPINKIVAVYDHAYFAKTDGLYDVDGHSSRSPNLTQQLAHVIDAENGVAAHTSGGDVYMGHRKGYLRVQTYGQDYGRTFVVQPGFGLPNETPIRGLVTASVQEGGWNVVAVYNGTDTYVCWGRDLNGGEQSVGPSPMLWHGGLIKLASSTCYLLHISNLTSVPTLWVGSGNNVQYCKLPRTEHPLQDTSSYEFATSYSLYIPGLDWNRVATPKNLLQIDVEGDNLGVGVSLAVNYNVEGGSYSVFGTANTSPQSQVLPTSEIIGRRIGLRLDGTGTVTSGANVRGLLLRAAARVKTRAIRTYQIRLAEGQGDNFRGMDNRDPATLWDALRRLETGQQVTLRDEFGETITALVHAPVSRDEVEEQVQGARSKTVQVVTLSLSVLKRQGSSFTWNSGATWDSGKTWG